MTGQTSPNAPQKYNKVYESLVKNDNDVVGFIAYGLYKRSKQKYITTFQKEYNKTPNDNELSSYVLCSEMPRLNNYRTEAKQILEVLLESAVSEKQATLEEDFQKKLWRYVKDHEPPSLIDKIYTFIKSSFSGVTGNFITTGLIIIGLFLLSSQELKDNLEYSATENFVSGVAKMLGVPVEVNPTGN